MKTVHLLVSDLKFEKNSLFYCLPISVFKFRCKTYEHIYFHWNIFAGRKLQIENVMEELLPVASEKSEFKNEHSYTYKLLGNFRFRGFSSRTKKHLMINRQILSGCNSMKERNTFKN